MALLLPKYKLAYVPLPRTGSTTVVYWLALYGETIGTGGGHRHATTGIPDGYRIMTSIRNPYTRIPSCWVYVYDRKHRMRYTFSRWLRRIYGKQRKNGNGGLKGMKTTMAEHLRPLLNRLDFVLRLESLENDLRMVCRKLGMPWKPLVQHKRNESSKQYQDMPYSMKDALVMQEKSREDFQVFGYSAEPLPERLL